MFSASGSVKKTTFSSTFGRGVLGAAVAALVLGGPPSAHAVVVTDGFSDLNDTANPTWTHLDGAAGSTGQTWDASTGRYRLLDPTTTTYGSTAPGLEGYGFVGSHVGPSFTDVRVTVDIVEFPYTGLYGSNFGIAARLNGNNGIPTPGIGIQLNGYGYQYESSADGGFGEMVIGVVYGDGIKDIGSQKVTLDNTKDYRFVLEAIGDTLHGQVFELDAGGGIVGMVAEDFRDLIAEPVGNVDHDADPLTPEIPFVPYTSGFSGVYGVGHALASDADFTIDNFRTETAVAGDYNRNGVADAADYVLWRDTFGSTGPDANPPTPYTGFGDMRANGAIANGYTQTIDQADYDVWKANFGATASGSGLGSGGAVPEPASAVLVVVGLVSLWFGRRNTGR